MLYLNMHSGGSIAPGGPVVPWAILVVDDRQSMAEMLGATLEGEGYRALISNDVGGALKRLKEDRIDLVLTDLKLPGRSGMEVLRAAREDDPSRPVIVMTAYGSVENAVQAMKQGAYDFITKPFDTEHMLMLVRRALDNRRVLAENIVLKEELAPKMPVIIGKSEGLAGVAEKIRRVAPARSTVLLLGESGTGKELFARAIHCLSPRKDNRFIAINCAAIPGELLESELFGFEKGAFTGADRKKPGKLELADRGTVFLDEVGELSLPMQAKLLRVLQEGEVERVGSSRPFKIDVRVIAASNKDLERAVSEKTFREDLYYRLNVFPLRIPPLRERMEDVPLLAEYFLGKYGVDLKRKVESISAEAVKTLCSYGWKGNVRELENTIERAVILSDGPSIRPEHIALASDACPAPALEGTLEEVGREALRRAESGRIRQALKAAGGNKTKAAEALQVSYKTLLTKIKDYDLE